MCALVRLFATPWTVACQAPLSMEFSRHECWSWLPCPPPGDLSDPGTEPTSPTAPALQVDSLPVEQLTILTKKAGVCICTLDSFFFFGPFILSLLVSGSESVCHSVMSNSLQPHKTIVRQAPLSMEFC